MWRESEARGEESEKDKDRENDVPESECFLVQLSAALVSEEENLVELPLLRDTVDANHRTL